MDCTFMTEHTPVPPGMRLPAALMGLHISSTVKIMYCRLLDAAFASGMADENGILFVHYPIAELAGDIFRCSMTVKRSMNELENAGLAMRMRQGIGKPNRIYVLIPEEEKTAQENMHPEIKKLE